MRSPSAPLASPGGYHERGQAGSQGGHQRGQAGKDSYYQLARDKAVLARGESSSRSSMARWEPSQVLEPPVSCQVWQVPELRAGGQGGQWPGRGQGGGHWGHADTCQRPGWARGWAARGQGLPGEPGVAAQGLQS